MSLIELSTALLVGLVVGGLGRLVVPDRRSFSIWLALAVGMVAALFGTVVADATGISTASPGIDWAELLVQVLLAALGVALVAAAGGHGRRRGL
ncbi:GlsB/YeaQ/YmgE family stress response membrane protein [Dactylosporangium matsuzakiense]|uniref:GlsB/YeaQ/YmgE family stress response membrane protein n=1 Tax=Dactylosporangium matsuzakiense TaxID=53360 RepID=A0A9W6NK22_9ACTN|nr:GlsB/YeaQ/YmgE family stress response membrane protein [Dactylosporangium matsuzakiense]UWZ42227.1 GlsB/YeaQ/YmgE family stress response membrane protein [Dactylosporangium matsuzakiense]GLK99878.1 hypothetical protein GCM10017581_016190 [Dactylosporangium matsuzakiense]